MRGSGRTCVLGFLDEKRSDGDGEREYKEGAVTKQAPNRQRIIVAKTAALDLNVQDQSARHGADENQDQRSGNRTDQTQAHAQNKERSQDGFQDREDSRHDLNG